MMKTRRDFLLRLFALLDERSLPFVVLRNFDSVFEDTDSDVDLLTHPRNLNAVYSAALDAARQTSHRLVQRVRFVNHSWVFWNGADGFVRVDVDTAIRWRWLGALDADTVLSARVRQKDFPVPGAEHQAEILRVQIATIGHAEERYQRRLTELGAQTTDAVRERRRLLVRNIANPFRWPRILGFAASDMCRLLRRWWRPPGITVQVIAAADFDAAALECSLTVLFPNSKRDALFKGGLTVNVTRVSSDTELAAAAQQFAHSADFVAVLESGKRLHAAHTDSGFMLSSASVGDLPHFICTTLARLLESSPKRRGTSVLLVGLDGAGKSTFARNLCAAAINLPRFSGCHYFHWIPSLSGKTEFPWPAFRDQPRKKAASPGLAASLTSALRLTRSVILARLVWFFRIAPALRTGRLVLLDRFVANYWLDPVSVRYAGSPGWLKIALLLLPQPDIVLTLDAAASVLRSRKGELTLEQISEQQARLRSLPALARRRVNLDAALSPDTLVRQTLTLLEDTSL
jgi:hypothetical protein